MPKADMKRKGHQMSSLPLSRGLGPRLPEKRRRPYQYFWSIAAAGHLQHDSAMKNILLAAVMVLATGPLSAQVALDRDAPVAFLGLTFLDTSTEGAYNGVREDETERLKLLEQTVTDRFADEGFTLMDLAPVAEELERTVNPAKCYGCDLRMGEKLGAGYILVGEVQKVSNLILAMNLVMRDVDTGEMVRGMSSEIRSNTDDSWLRGMRYILKNNFFKS